MSPIQKFETAAQQIWTSDMRPMQKADRLSQVHEAISSYLVRAMDKADVKTADPWQDLARCRALGYLKSLAHDVHELEVSCRQQARTRA